MLANVKRGNQKYALNTKSPLYFNIHNESIICTKEPDGILEDADEMIWVNSYYDDEMQDLRNKFTRLENDIKDFDSTILRKIGNFYYINVAEVHSFI